MRRSVFLLLLAGLLAACGQKGPLYLPSSPPAAQPAPAAVPDKDAAGKAEKEEDTPQAAQP